MTTLMLGVSGAVFPFSSGEVHRASRVDTSAAEMCGLESCWLVQDAPVMSLLPCAMSVLNFVSFR